MQDVFIIADNIYAPLGATTAENFEAVCNNISGIKLHNNPSLSPEPVYASLLGKVVENSGFTRFESLLIASITDALQNSGIAANDPKTAFILSSTKGNISLLETQPYSNDLKEKISLHGSAKKIAAHFGFVHQPVVVSNACISGLLGIIMAKRLIASGQYENVVVAGADMISKFVLSGFQSFQAVSPEPCKPFDAGRSGITLGEGAATVILSSNKNLSKGVRVRGGGVSNDANHISAPSRTGAELAYIITGSLAESGLAANDIGMVSAHGTATVYNDEMEAKALVLSGLSEIPANSLKGFYGHTLGAAGLIESIISVHAMMKNWVLPTRGFDSLGVAAGVFITKERLHRTMQHCIKTASGFGGCNAALIFSKQ